MKFTTELITVERTHDTVVFSHSEVVAMCRLAIREYNRERGNDWEFPVCVGQFKLTPDGGLKYIFPATEGM